MDTVETTETSTLDAISSKVKDKFSVTNVAEEAAATIIVLAVVGASKLITKAVVKKYQERREVKNRRSQMEIVQS